MGQALESISKHSGAIATAVGFIGLLAYGLKESYQKTQLLRLLRRLQISQSSAISSNDIYLGKGESSEPSHPSSDQPIYKVAITGGPCAGKSTSLGSIRNEMEKFGFRVLGVPQIPTLVVKAGGMILMSKFNLQERIKFQTLLIHFQMYAEDYFTKLAALFKSPCIVLCDRGTVDPAAYVSKEQFQSIMDEEGWNFVSLRDKRYDRVIFLQSAANGAQNFYTLQNNVARSQGIELARSLDKKTLQVWTGHPHLTICPNVEGETFEQKIFRAVKAVKDTVGLEKSCNFIEKFLIRKPVFPAELKHQISEIQEIFLKNEDEKYTEDKIKRQGQDRSYTYQRKLRGKKDQSGNFRLEIRKPLTSVQYAILREQRSDPTHKVISRNRLSFNFNSLSYSIDVYDAHLIHHEALKEAKLQGQQFVYILRFENDREDPKELIPPFVAMIQNLRHDKRFSLKHIAKITQ